MSNFTLDRAVKRYSANAGFTLALVGLLLLSLALRFWGLGRFNTLVFDEVYFAKFASHYLKGIPLFEGHPPLSTYILAIGIWIAEHTPIGAGIVKNDLSGLYLSPVSYRWLDALVGAFIPLVVAAIAYELTHRRSFAFIAGLFLAVDGLFLVESRYALINVFLILFGLLGHWFFLRALNFSSSQRGLWLIAAGVCLGAAPAVKWNGLGYLLGIYLLLFVAWAFKAVQHLMRRSNLPLARSISSSISPLQNLTQLHPVQLIATLGLIPALTYYLSWLPYLSLDRSITFWQWQARIIDYHHRVGGMDVHPYCSRWYSWIFMWRPVAYFYKTSHGPNEPAPIVGPPLPLVSERTIYDVHAMGNPVLWWFAIAAIALLAVLLVAEAGLWLRQRPVSDAVYTGAAFYLLLNWIANLLPWVSVTRCVFIYHYMESVVFSFLALALVVDRWLWSPRDWQRVVGLTIIFLILIAFVFWLPMFLGLPLTLEGILSRRWLQSWI